MNIIDSHVHFWNYQPDNAEFAWISEEMAILKRDYLPKDLPSESELSGSTERKYVAVQARQSMEETMFLLELADNNPMIAGVVGWIDWKYPEIGKSYTNLTKHKKLKGFRHIIQDEKQGFMRNPTFRHSIRKIASRFTYDLLIKPTQILEAAELVEEFPEQMFVLDHLAKPDVKNKDFGQWTEDIEKLKNFDNLFCKLSGLVTEAHWQDWTESDFTYILDVAFRTFGPDRLMFGSDWPVCMLAADYKKVYNLVLNYVDSQSSISKANIMCNNAVKFYNL